jgi:cytochrome P450 family 6
MYRYTTDVIASCAFGISCHSLKDPDAEFRRYARNIFDFSVREGLAALTAFSSPALTSLLKLKCVDDESTNYVRKTIWSTVEYRSDTSIFSCHINYMVMNLCKQKLIQFYVKPILICAE